MAELIDGRGGLALLSEHLGISIEDLKKVSEDKREAARLARLEAQLLEQQAQQTAAIEKAHKLFNEAWKTGTIAIRVDGRLLAKPQDLCKSGTPELDPVVRRVAETRRRLINNFRGFGGGFDESIRTGATVIRSVPCSCGKTHELMILISSEK